MKTLTNSLRRLRHALAASGVVASIVTALGGVLLSGPVCAASHVDKATVDSALSGFIQSKALVGVSALV